MASTDYDFTLTRNEIIESAFEVIGAHYTGESLSAEMMSQGVKSLNAMVKSWQTKSVFLWTQVIESVTLVTDQASYSLSNDPPAMAIEKAYRVNGTSNEDIDVLSYEDYYDLDTSITGTVREVYFDSKNAPSLFVYPTPAAAGTLKLWVTTLLKDFDSADGATDFPVRWLDALVFGLASRLAPKYRLPIGERRDLRAEADRFFGEAKASNRDRTDLGNFLRGAY